MLVHFLIICACAALNRVRGTSWLVDKFRLPGRSLYYVSPMIALIALIESGAWAAIWGGLAYLLWGVWPHGRWFDLGRHPEGYNRDGVEPTILELVVGAISFGSDHVALFLRHLLILPGLIILFWGAGLLWPLALSIAFAAAVVAIYEAAWRFIPTYPIPVAEVATGALWGLLILAA